MPDDLFMDVKLNYEKIKPKSDIVLVKIDIPPIKTHAGILLGGDPNRQEFFRKGTVIAVGPGLWNKENTARIPLETKPGDRVLLPYNVGGQLDQKKIDPEKGDRLHILLKDKEIPAILEAGSEPEGSEKQPAVKQKLGLDGKPIIIEATGAAAKSFKGV